MARIVDMAVAALERAAGKPVPDPAAIRRDIENAIAACPATSKEASPRLLDRCIRSLALIYVRTTGKLPGYSNSDNITHFERFLQGLELPPHLRATSTHVRAAIRRLAAKDDPEFQKLIGRDAAAPDDSVA